MDYTVHGVAKSWTRLSNFHFQQSIEQSPLCYTLNPCWLSILNIAVCTCQSQIPSLFLLFPPNNDKFALYVCESISVL